MATLTKDSYMRFGKYAGKPLKDIPTDYLSWLFHHLSLQKKLGPLERDMWNYLNNNAEELKLLT